MRAQASTLLLLLGGLASAQPLTTQVQPLSGMGDQEEQPVLWDFRLDAGRGSGAWTRIRVPSVWEQEGFGAYFYGFVARDKPDDDPGIPREQGTYRTTFTVPDAYRGPHAKLVFGGVMTDATVLVNGQPAGAVHRGGFYQFDYDVSSLVRAGQANTLEVRVDKESADPSVNRAERRGDYWTFGGIFRPVWLEYSPQAHIGRVAIDAKADGTFKAQVFLSAADVPRRSRVLITNAAGRAVAASDWTEAPVDQNEVTLRVHAVNPLLWTAETPHLYTAKFELETRNAQGVWRQQHETQERFGFRTFEVRVGDGLYLNGRRIILKGVNRHSFLPRSGRTLTRQENQRDVQLMKEANLNAVRMAHYPPDKSFLDAADEAGLYVINELGGWQKAYDKEIGAQLIGEVVRRDVNHPSILFWANGNEGGWVAANDAEFARWDPQHRPVLHPWAINSGINTDHYETYDSTARLSAGEHIFMPTEFLHALYDGGGGAGLEDYWELLRSGPHPAGGFIWSWRDEGIERTDQDGRIDTQGNFAADGVIGPQGEKEGSYFAIKQIWSPVQLKNLRVDGTRLRMHLENRYDFLDLGTTRLRWRAVRLPTARHWRTQSDAIGTGEVRGPSIAPGGQADFAIALPAKVLAAATDVYLDVIDREGRELWTWSAAIARTPAADPPLDASEIQIAFDDATGRITQIHRNGKQYPLAGPKLVAFSRQDMAYVPVQTQPARLESFEKFSSDPRGRLAVAKYSGVLRELTWSLSDGRLVLEYELAPNGTYDLLGVAFDLPSDWVASKRWLGEGPYRVWQNRTAGGVRGIHANAYAEDVPGQSYLYPEFKGYFAKWDWLAMNGKDGDSIVASNESGIPYVGAYAPTGGEQLPAYPDTGWSFLHVIPSMGSKFKKPTDLGTSSQPQTLSQPLRGRIEFSFE